MITLVTNTAQHSHKTKMKQLNGGERQNSGLLIIATGGLKSGYPNIVPFVDWVLLPL